MTARIRHLLVAVALATLVACGGDDGADSPTGKCRALVDLSCERLAECFAGVITEESCHAEVDSQIPCDDAVSVGATYDSCMDMLDSRTCDDLFPPGATPALPADCQQVIMIGG